MTARMFRQTAWSAICALAVVLAHSVFAQDVARFIRIRKLDGLKVRTPEYKITTGTVQGKTRDWFQLRTEYDTAPDWIDEVTFQYFVLVRGKEARARPTVLKGEITYVNVEKGNRHQSVAYLHPSTLARYGEVERMAVGVTYRGQTIWETNPSGAQRWWEELPPVSGYILNRMETPFAMINFDDYEAIKAATPR
ncbi:MAG: hypothetical protein JXB04_06680 [Kiritimatiellae bacterium]|nr:hypothetical protein [Kiritimatiellia bacterium]